MPSPKRWLRKPNQNKQRQETNGGEPEDFVGAEDETLGGDLLGDVGGGLSVA